jgi:5-methyltetrahydrofolate--homocysteine methyltransferase
MTGDKMGIILDRLSEGEILISDGACGTMLQAKGLTPDTCPEEWNLSHRAEVEAVARAYSDAGSDIVLTNTFGGTRIKLARYGYGDRVADFNIAGARNAATGAADAIVVGSIGPTGEFLSPLGTLSGYELVDIYAEQISALIEGGVQAICIETMADVQEAACAVRAAKRIDPDIDVIATFTFEEGPAGFRTMMGADIRLVVDTMTAAGADIIGSNCGNGIDRMAEITAEFKGHIEIPILIHANAGLPELVDGQTVFRQTPEDFAAGAKSLTEAGASIIGGCCGTTPEHITAMKAAIA